MDKAVTATKPPEVTELVTREKVKEWLKAFGHTADLSEEEQDQFIGIARELQLNPFKREIHVSAFGRGENRRVSIMTGYEVYLKRAERLNTLDGWKVWIEGEGEQMAAKIIIHRKDWSEPFEWEVYLKEAVQRKGSGEVNHFWTKQPRFMLKKVCVAQGFRLCFPDEMGSLPYLSEEVDANYQEEPRNVTPPAPTDGKQATQIDKAVEPARRKVLDRLHELVNGGQIEKPDAREWERELNKAALMQPGAEALAAIAGIKLRLERTVKDTKELDDAATQSFTEDEPEEQGEFF